MISEFVLVNNKISSWLRKQVNVFDGDIDFFPCMFALDKVGGKFGCVASCKKKHEKA